ncbi:E3 ubiquitin-protein ligase TRIM39-like [Clupea harengus]|uniref:E3 ubiquitin-protein ligase TRIM39-like n=1 Tax=Clupea harengus TaxID=7950 RepID=A0A6P8GNP5_CLUHA|nr:E3 ubiquitin-protein ligase TRIM39-like [Clupea harengus]
MSEYIYESPDACEESKPRRDTDGDIYANVAVYRRHTVQDSPTVQKAGPFKLAVVCLVLLSVVLLTVILGLCVKSHTERDELQTQICNLEVMLKQYAVNITLDPYTAFRKLLLSADRKQVSYGSHMNQNDPGNPKRFSRVSSVLAAEGFTSGRFYYEVQVRGKTSWVLGVVRESIKKKETVVLSPAHGYWGIRMENKRVHLSLSVPLTLEQNPQRVGVFVDYKAGEVSFYDADSWNQIYSYRGVVFNEPIYPYFNPRATYGGRNSSPLIITTPVPCEKQPKV